MCTCLRKKNERCTHLLEVLLLRKLVLDNFDGPRARLHLHPAGLKVRQKLAVHVFDLDRQDVAQLCQLADGKEGVFVRGPAKASGGGGGGGGLRVGMRLMGGE